MLAALGYLEAHTAGSRRGRGGHERINVAGLVVAAFRHRSSRAGNPLLHTHVLVTNLGRALDDGKRRTLDSRRIYAHTKTAGYVYQAQLRHELSCRLGAEWTPSRTGTADLVGIGESVIRDFSHRRIEAEAAMAARGETSARAAQASTLETRRAKDNGATAETLRSAWRERATELGLIASAVERVTGPVHSRDATDHQCGVGSLGCSARAGSPSTKRLLCTGDVVRGWCEELPTAPAAQLAALTDELLKCRLAALRINRGVGRRTHSHPQGRRAIAGHEKLRWYWAAQRSRRGVHGPCTVPSYSLSCPRRSRHHRRWTL